MILDQLRSKLVEYSKAKDTLRLGVLRYFLSKIKEREIELRPSGEVINDDIAFKILRKQVKERNQSIELYEKGNRPDLVQKEAAELEILKEFAKLFPFELDLPTR
jgi:uncharacterized protein